MLFTLNTLLVLMIFKFLSCIFVENDLIRKGKVNFKIYDAITWLTNNCNTHIDQYLKKERDRAIIFGQLIERNMRIFNFFKKNMHKMQWRYYSQSFY